MSALSVVGLHAGLVLKLRVLVAPAQSLGQSRNRQVPRAPLPASGVTSGNETSSISSEGVTPPSSLLRAHASDQNPPFDFSCPYFEGSLQVAVSPCWKLALPDVISTICVEVLGPIPRRVPGVRSVCSSALHGTDDGTQDVGLTLVLTSSARETIPAMQLQQEGSFRGCSHSLMFRLLYSLGPPVAPTAVTSTGQPGRLHHAMDMWLPALNRSRFYMNCDIATYPKRTN